MRLREPVVVDTGVFGARLTPRSPLKDLYQPLLLGRPAFVSFQTVAELRYGAIRAHWGPTRVRRLEELLTEAEIVWPGPLLVDTYAQLRAECMEAGHALGQREHDADRWIAAAAIRLDVPLVSHDGVFRDVPGLRLETLL